jgi:hypothetical protein
MRRTRFTEPGRIFAGLLAGLLLATLAVPVFAQSADDSRMSYDITQEVTISGTVSGVLTRPAPGIVWGSHLLLTTLSGTVDASLGRWAFAGKAALSVSVGQQVEVTGITKTLNGKPVFLARTVKAGGKVYTMRNEHGIPVSPQARVRAAERGESR